MTSRTRGAGLQTSLPMTSSRWTRTATATTDHPDDIPGLNLPFCMLSALDLSGVTLGPSFASGTVAYTADVANTVEATTVTATLNADPNDRLSIRKGTASLRERRRRCRSPRGRT